MTKIGGNRWNDFVREFASKHNTTYGCAISMPECKAEYKAKYPKPVKEKKAKKVKEVKPKSKRGRPKKSQPAEDFGLAPEAVSIEPIQLHIQELEEAKPQAKDVPNFKEKTIKVKKRVKFEPLEIATPQAKDLPNYKAKQIIIKRKEKPKEEATKVKKIEYKGKKYYKESKAEEDGDHAIYEIGTLEHIGYLKPNGTIKFFNDESESESDSDESVSSADSRNYLGEIRNMMGMFDEDASKEELKRIKKFIGEMRGFDEAGKFTEAEHTDFIKLVRKFNVAVKKNNSKKEGKGRINRIRLKRRKSGKDEEGGTRTEAIGKVIRGACDAVSGCVRGDRANVYDANNVNATTSQVNPNATPDQIRNMNVQIVRSAINRGKKAKKGNKVAHISSSDIGFLNPIATDIDTGEGHMLEIADGMLGKRRRGRPKKGGNAITDLANKVSQFKQQATQKASDITKQAVSSITPQPVKDVVKDVGNRFFGDELPNNVKATLKKYGDQQITGLTLGRTPVPRYITEALNVVSLGEWKKKFASKPYDTLYHLFLIIKTTGGQFLIEKNERINTSQSIPKNAETSVISGNFSGLTPNILLENAQKLLGENAFKNYDPYNNNCQHFITAILKANHLGSPADLAFVKQDTESLFENSPQTATFAKTLTDLGARVSKIVGKGEKKPRGRPRKIGGVATPQLAQILNPMFAENPNLYYNPLLQHVGAKTQRGIPWGIGANAGGYETDSSSSSDSDSDSDGEYVGGITPEIQAQIAELRQRIQDVKTLIRNTNNTNALTFYRGLIRSLEDQINVLKTPRVPTIPNNQYENEVNAPPATPEGLGRNPELKHELKNYNDILGHLSSHLLSSEKQDPKDLRDALKYAKELVRVLQQFRQ